MVTEPSLAAELSSEPASASAASAIFIPAWSSTPGPRSVTGWWSTPGRYWEQTVSATSATRTNGVQYTQFPQQGTLVIEDDVDIGANTTIDRGALEETRIARGTKLDNLIHIGHNCNIGRNVVIAAQTGISGSSAVGDGAILGGQVGMGDHAMVGPGVILGGQAGILPKKKLLGPGIVFWGTPAKPVRQYSLSELARAAGPG